eukprot:jgi/Orpsp1_1/1186924/evm.model.d7180000054141.1
MNLNFDNVLLKGFGGIINDINDLNTLNVMVLGKTGVGKSTLINNLFKGNIAETGVGTPITKEIKRFKNENYPLAIYDVPGFELIKKQQNEVINDIKNIIKNGYMSNDINHAIHCILYCIDCNSNRIDEIEKGFIKLLSSENRNIEVPVPIIIVLTQSINKNTIDGLKRIISDLNLGVIDIVPVLAEKMESVDNITIESFGLDKLVEVMEINLPRELKITMRKMQIVNQSIIERISSIFAENVMNSEVLINYFKSFKKISFLLMITEIYIVILYVLLS